MNSASITVGPDVIEYIRGDIYNEVLKQSQSDKQEIERLRKALEQALGEPVKWEELETAWLLTEKTIKASTHAELAAYLRERDTKEEAV